MPDESCIECRWIEIVTLKRVPRITRYHCERQLLSTGGAQDSHLAVTSDYWCDQFKERENG